MIENAVARVKSKIFGRKIFTLFDLISYAQRNSNVPIDENQPYVVLFWTSDDPKKFVLSWSTKKLLRFCSSQQFLQV